MNALRPLTPKAEKEIEEMWALQKEAARLLDVIAAEFKSDPMSVQCFDLRTVQRAIEVSARLRKLEPVYSMSF